MLALVLFASGTLALGALAAVLLVRSDRAALVVSSAIGVLGCALGAIASAGALWARTNEEMLAAWSLPIGEVRIGLDPLSAFFLLCMFVVSGLSAMYGIGYLRGYLGKRRLVSALAFFHLMVASMAILVVARDAVLFLAAWEVMSITSYFLVTYEDDREAVRRAGMTYLIASHLGVVSLFVAFGLLARGAGGSFSFAALAATHAPEASLVFLLSLVGFGTKAGFWPVHIWLPDAHPAAPSHVSALMSGAMIKMGIYGLLRVLTFLGEPEPWWGAVVLGIGAVTGLAGVLLALAQHDLKRLLAYSSVENIGIVALGIGVALLAQSHGQASLAFVAYAGALLHVLNHGLFKGLLFQGAGAVLHATGTRNMEMLGGLSRRMPVTAICFLVGAIAICGLPPLNGFASEWLVYLSAFRTTTASTGWGAAAIVAVPALALIGGLAAATFVKAFGLVFLGQPRRRAAADAHEADLPMRVSMITGALACAAIGLWPSGALHIVEAPASALAGGGGVDQAAFGALSSITVVAIALLAIVLALAILRALLLRGRDVRSAPTWGCGYEAPSARMQYTAGSFAEPALAPFAPALPKEVHAEGPEGFFPTDARYVEHLGDMAGERLLVPAVTRALRTLGRFRVIQAGRIQVYLAYVLVTLVALLFWQFALGGGSGSAAP